MRYALRLFAKTPGFTAVAVLTLALGIGANTAVFSVVDALLLRSLPMRQPDRLLVMTSSSQKRGLSGLPLSLTLFQMLQSGGKSYSAVGAYAFDGFTYTGVGEPAQLAAARVSANFFDVLGVNLARGRPFSPAEGEIGGPLAAILSDSLWRNRLASDPAIIGKPIQLSGNVYTVIGVLPPEFRFLAVDVWVSRLADYQPLRAEQVQHGAGFLTGVGRLKDGVTESAAAAEAAVIGHSYAASHPGFADAEPGMRVDVQELAENTVSGIRTTLLVLMAAVGCVLIIACTNVASLTLARATGRAKEMALRAALGAGRGTLLRQLLAESALLAAAGAVTGVLLAQLCLDLAAKALARYAAGFGDVSIDARVLIFTLAVTAVTAVGFGLMPAWRISRPDLNNVLRESNRGNTGGVPRQRARNLLIVAQAAISVVLLIGAGLLIQSFRRLAAVDPGFHPDHAITMNVNLPSEKYADDAARSQFARTVLSRIGALPGVQSASGGSSLPLIAFQVMSMVLPQGQPFVPIERRPLANWITITPGYFQSLGIPLLAGRDFTAADDGASKAVVIINQELAHRYWPNENPIGKHIVFTRREIGFEVVGVTGDVKTTTLNAATRATVYTNYAQYSRPTIWFTVRTAGDPNGVAKAAEAQIFAVDHSQPVTAVQTLDEFVATTLSQSRQIAYLVGGFAVVALALAMIGLYGVMSYSVAQRTTEIGVRQAVGASRMDILRMVLKQGLALEFGRGGDWSRRRRVRHPTPHEPTLRGHANRPLGLWRHRGSFCGDRRDRQFDPRMARDSGRSGRSPALKNSVVQIGEPDHAIGAAPGWIETHVHLAAPSRSLRCRSSARQSIPREQGGQSARDPGAQFTPGQSAQILVRLHLDGTREF